MTSGSTDSSGTTSFVFFSFFSFLSSFSFGSATAPDPPPSRVPLCPKRTPKSTKPSLPRISRNRSRAESTDTARLTSHARSNPYASHKRRCRVLTKLSTDATCRALPVTSLRESSFSGDGWVDPDCTVPPVPVSTPTSTKLSNTSALVRNVATSGFVCVPFRMRFKNPPTRFSSRRNSPRVVFLYVLVCTESRVKVAAVVALGSIVCVGAFSSPPFSAEASASPSVTASASARSSASFAVAIAAVAPSESSSKAAQCARLTCMLATASAVSTVARCVFAGSWKKTHSRPRSQRPAFQN
mmetsp:Transcript_9840/g.36541  ORF Transcript_9840/g.36541 Transcript_9840/m.36541 type:complete len:298 (-) Transcript_9840:1172-2065(-)